MKEPEQREREGQCAREGGREEAVAGEGRKERGSSPTIEVYMFYLASFPPNFV